MFCAFCRMTFRGYSFFSRRTAPMISGSSRATSFSRLPGSKASRMSPAATPWRRRNSSRGTPTRTSASSGWPVYV